MSADTKQAVLVIYESENGRDGWRPLKFEDVPAWVKHPDNVAQMLAGKECMKADEGEAGSNWYRAVRVADMASVRRDLASTKRERRNAKRARTLH